MTPTAQVEAIRRLHIVRTPVPGLGRESTASGRQEKPPWRTDTFRPVLSIRARVEGPEVPSFIRDALQEIRSHIKEHHVEVQGPPFSICRPASPHGVDVEVGWPVRRATGTGRIQCGALPTGLVRSDEARIARNECSRRTMKPLATAGELTSEQSLTEKRHISVRLEALSA
jgi:hypothetical protein